MAPLVDGWDYASWSAVYNTLSLGTAGMGSATFFFCLQIPRVSEEYRTALCVRCLVTLIATYHYFRTFHSWIDAFEVKFDEKEGDYVVILSGIPFNDAYRYVDWLVTGPLLLIELTLLLGLTPEEVLKRGAGLVLVSVVTVALSRPGETQEEPGPGWLWSAVGMVFFVCVVAQLLLGGPADAAPPGSSRCSARRRRRLAPLLRGARWLTAISWCMYPAVCLIKPRAWLASVAATAGEQIGYAVADVLGKVAFGLLVWAIAAEQSRDDEERQVPFAEVRGLKVRRCVDPQSDVPQSGVRTQKYR